METKKIIGSIKTLLGGVLCIIFACLFWIHVFGNPINEFMLITRNTQTTIGCLVDTIEHDSEDDRGRVSVWDEGIYTFYVPKKGEFKTSTEAPLGELKKQEEVEYLSNNPTVNRVKGDGCQSVIEFLLRKVGAGGLLFVLFLSPGVIIFKNGIRKIREVCMSQKEIK